MESVSSGDPSGGTYKVDQSAEDELECYSENEESSNDIPMNDSKVNRIKRRSFSFEEKLKIIKLLDTLSKRIVCNQFSLDESTLNKWIKQSKKIEVICNDNYAKKLKKQKISAITEVDDILYTWFLKERAKGAHLSGPIIKARALMISTKLGILNFKASERWFGGWKNRKDVRLKMQRTKSSVNESATINYKHDLEQIISRDQLTRAQVFSFDKSMLNCRLLPTYTSASENEQPTPGFKKDKSPVIFAECSNDDGSLKVPILVIGHSVKARGLKTRSDQNLPSSHSKTPWMTPSIFKNWFETEFVPEVQIFLNKIGLPIKALLLVDNCKSNVMLSVGDIRTYFFPSNITRQDDFSRSSSKNPLETYEGMEQINLERDAEWGTPFITEWLPIQEEETY